VNEKQWRILCRFMLFMLRRFGNFPASGRGELKLLKDLEYEAYRPDDRPEDRV
jgi:hypothetical protein